MRSLVLLLVLLAALVAHVSASCYYPDGSNANNDYIYEPCGNSGFSTCCYFGEGDKCLDNGLCQQPGKDFYRAACSNKDWSGCPKTCMDRDRGTWFQLQECGDNQYCCPPASGDNCCTSGAQIFTLETSNSTSSSSSSSSSADSTSGSGSGSNSGTSSSDGQTTVVVTSTSGGGSVPAGPIAGGVVGGLFVIGLFVFGCFFFKRKGKKTVAPASPEAGGDAAGDVAVGAAALGKTSSDGKRSSSVKAPPRMSILELAGQQGKVWNETDGRPVIQVGPSIGDEKLDFFSQATTPSPSGHPATLASGVMEAGGNPVITHTVQPPRTPTLVQQTPITQYAAEMDAGGMTSSSGSSVNSAPVGQHVTHLAAAPVKQANTSGLPAEMHVPGGVAAAHQQDGSQTSSPSVQQAYPPQPQQTAEVEGTVAMQTALGPMVSTTIEQSYAPASSLTTQRTRSTRRAAEMDSGAVARTPSPANSTSTLGKNKIHTGMSTPQQAAGTVGRSVMEADSNPVATAVQTHIQTTSVPTQHTSTVAGGHYMAEVDGGAVPNTVHNDMTQTHAIHHFAEADGRVIMEADSSPAVYSTAFGQHSAQPRTMQSTTNTYNMAEMDGFAVMEADSRPADTLLVQQSRAQTTTTSSHNAVEMDSVPISEADSSPVLPRGQSRTHTSARPQGAVEVDSRVVMEADSNPVIPARIADDASRTTEMASEQQRQAHELS